MPHPLIPDEALAEAHRLAAELDAELERLEVAGIDPRSDRKRQYELVDQLDAVLGPVCRSALRSTDGDLASLIGLLPSGFHRGELAVHLARRQAKAGGGGPDP